MRQRGIPGARADVAGLAPDLRPPLAQGMRKEEPELDVRHAATVALQNALTFAHNNFGNDGERNYIMQITCEGTLSGEWQRAAGDGGGVRRRCRRWAGRQMLCRQARKLVDATTVLGTTKHAV